MKKIIRILTITFLILGSIQSFTREARAQSVLFLCHEPQPTLAFCGTTRDCVMKDGKCIERLKDMYLCCGDPKVNPDDPLGALGELILNCTTCKPEGNWYLSNQPRECAMSACIPEEDCNCDGINCAVSCAAGESTTNTGPLCRTVRTNKCDDSCGNDNQCSDSKSCYTAETNIEAPSTPTEIQSEDTTLSTDINNPSSAEKENLSLSIPAITAPTSSRGVGYYFKIFDSSNNEIYSSPTPTADANNRVNTENTITIPQDSIDQLTEGDEYKISAMYYTLDRCNYTVKYSTPIEAYIIINNIPQPVCPGGNCTKSDILPDLGNDPAYGCTNQSYTGIEMNNPLNFSVSLEDLDGNHEIEGLIIWLRDQSSSEITDLGIKIQKTTDWNNLETYYTHGSSWISFDDYITNSSGDNIARILNTTASENENVNIQTSLELLPSEITLEGTYGIYLEGIDTNTVNNTNLDPTRMTYIDNLEIDLTNPVLDDEIDIDLTDIQNILFSWNAIDNETGILTSRVNGYVSTDNQAFETSTIFLNDIEITNVTAPEGEDPDEIGNMEDPYGITINPPTEEVTLNIGNNEYGDVSIYVRTFDNACNSDIRTNNISFAPWTSTQGGYFFSENGTRVETKDVSNLTELNEKLENFTVETIMQGTEVLSSRNQKIYDIIHPQLKAVSATRSEDYNNTTPFWFNNILKISEITDKYIDQECTAEYCFVYSEEDISLPENHTCERSTLYLSQNNITIPYQETSTNNNDTACIYVAKNNIYITNTGHEAISEDIDYDYLEGFFIAENQIIVNSGTTEEDKKYGIEIEGGLVAFGRTAARSIQNNRSLGAYNLIAPSLLVNYHPKYSEISQELVGTISNTYTKEVGLNRK